MRVDAMIVPGTAAESLNAKEAYEVQFAINFNDAEKATLEQVRRHPFLLKKSSAALQNALSANCIVEERSAPEYDTLVAAQGALVDFMAAVAEVLAEAQEQKSTTSS